MHNFTPNHILTIVTSTTMLKYDVSSGPYRNDNDN